MQSKPQMFNILKRLVTIGRKVFELEIGQCTRTDTTTDRDDDGLTDGRGDYCRAPVLREETLMKKYQVVLYFY